jgi:hypothetical protein
MKVTAPDVAAQAGGATASSSPAAAVNQPAPTARSHGSPIRLVVRAADGRTVLNSTVGVVDPKRVTGGGYAPIDPPAWDQAVWVRYRPLVAPDDTSDGTSYVYGHACHHHVCAFTRLDQVRPGASIVVDAGARSTRYVVTRTSAAYPKSGPRSLANRTSGVADRSIANRLVLITCAYETGDVSLNNFVVVAVRRTS